MKNLNPGIRGGLSLDGNPEHIRDYYCQWAARYDQAHYQVCRVLT